MKYKLPESVLVVVFSRDKQVLMLERLRPQSFWQSVTGSLHEGETELAAAERELEEETGLRGHLIETGITNTFPISSVWRERYAPEITHNHETVFSLQLDAASEVRLNPDEHTQQRWLAYLEAAKLASSWTNRDAILAIVGK